MKRIVRDQLGRKVVIPFEPQRIISLVPSITEYVVDLNIEPRLVGITRYCTKPANVANGRTVVGGTKKFDFEKIASLKPDLIIANKEENYQSGVEELAKRYPVWVSDINNLDEALSALQSIAELTDTGSLGREICQKIHQQFVGHSEMGDKPRVCYMIWRKPWMVCGSNNFIDDMLARAGFKNVFSTSGDRYPAVTVDEIAAEKPQYLFLSSEPYPFHESHIEELKNLLPQSCACLVDAEPFSWYGSRLLNCVSYFSSLRKRLGISSGPST